MNRVKLDIDGVIVYDSGMVTPTPPPIPPPTPTPPPATGTELMWNVTSGFINVSSGNTYNYWVNNIDEGRSRLEILVFGETLNVGALCTLRFPDVRQFTQGVGYGGNTNNFYWRSQAYGVYPNIPDMYIPKGIFQLQIVCTGSGQIRIRTRLD